jgi:hypothetical protein
VQLDMLPAQEKPLPKRVRTIGKPGVRAPFNPPVVLDITPATGPAGTAISFTGRNLAGWRATVVAADQAVLDKQSLTGDSFNATIPAGTPPGFYDIRVDISRLFRRAFLFEVTP